MRKLIVSLMVVLFSMFLINPSQAKTIKKIAQTGLQFLKVDMLARPAGMGGAFSMAGKGVDAIFYNPAGLTEMETSLDVLGAMTMWIAEINYMTVGVAKDLGNLGIVGLSLVNADYGDIMGTRVNPDIDAGYETTGNLTVGGYAFGLAYARSLTDKFSVGAHFKYAGQQLGSNKMPGTGKVEDNKVSGLAYDFGTIFRPGFKSLRLGMTIRNFSPQFKYEEESFELPLTFRLGVAMDIFDLIGSPPPNSSFLLAVDALHPRDYTERVHIGGEYLFADMLAFRAGYKTNYDEESFSLGFGIKYNLGGIGLKVDYSYSDLGVFEGVNRITVGGTF